MSYDGPGPSQFTSNECSSEASLEEGRCQRRRKASVPSGPLPFPQPIPNPSQPGLQPAAAAEEAADGAAPTAEFAGGGAVLALRDVGLELALLSARSAWMLGRDARQPGMKVASDFRGP